MEYYQELFKPVLASRPWIVTADAAAGAYRNAQRLLDAGAPGVMVVGGTAGTGPPAANEVEVFLLGTSGATMMEGIRAFQAGIAHPPDDLCAAIGEWDPAGTAAVLANFLNHNGELCGRPVVGASLDTWKALENKITVDALWDRSGVAGPASAVVDAADSAAITTSAQRLDHGHGAVVVADNREGWNGGAEYTRYLAPDANWSMALNFIGEHATQARVTPFMRGTPCSIHGLVLEDQVLAFRPVEMLVYRRADSDQFVYCGMNTVWDPPATIRDAMRAAVKAVGAQIRDEVEYRGYFGIDGVHAESGFLPTELNPRLTASLGLMSGHPHGDINRAVIEGIQVDLRPIELEQEIIDSGDAQRSGRWLRPITHMVVEETSEVSIQWDGERWNTCAEADADATMSVGPSAQGALVMVRLTEHHGFESGPSIAAIAASSFALADETWDTRIGPLIPGSA